jgi:hypothetical protein
MRRTHEPLLYAWLLVLHCQVVEGQSKRAVQLAGHDGAVYSLGDAAALSDVQLGDALDRAAAEDEVLRLMLQQLRARKRCRLRVAWVAVRCHVERCRSRR